MNRFFASLALAGVLIYLISGCSDLGDNPPTSGGPQTDSISYANQIQPLFDAHCVSCHGAIANAQLDLRTYDGVMDSIGTHAPVVIPFDPDGSYLVQILEGTVQPRMPQGGPYFTLSTIDLIRQWIMEGALETSGGPPPPPPVDSVSYIAEIQPLFNSHCIGCHNSPASPSYGNLDLTTYAGLTSPNVNTPPAILPGDSANSNLILRIKGEVTPLMPQGQISLTNAQISLICLWIQQGAINDSTGGGGTDTTYYGQVIQPIFDDYCVACHASPESPNYGLLDMTTYAGVMDSTGPNAPVVISGSPANSYLMKKIEGAAGISGDRMPPGGPYLSPALTDTISQWIADGAQGGGGGGGSGPASFAGDILPLLQTRCATAGCHIQPEPPENLLLDSYSHVMAGSENGDVVVAGNSGASLLYTLCLPAAGENRMPQGGPWLTDGQTDMIAEWIDDGASNN